MLSKFFHLQGCPCLIPSIWSSRTHKSHLRLTGVWITAALSECGMAFTGRAEVIITLGYWKCFISLSLVREECVHMCECVCYTYVCMCVHVHVYTHVCIRIYSHMGIYVCLCLYICACMYVKIHWAVCWRFVYLSKYIRHKHLFEM